MSIKKSEISKLFSERLTLVMDMLGYGGRQNKKFADKIGISPSFLSDVLNLKSGPSYSLIFGISNNFEKVNLQWLLTGKGEPLLDHSPLQELKEIDAELLQTIIISIEEGLNERDLELAPVKKAELITLLYDHFAEADKKIDQNTVRRYLRLVA